MFNVLQDMQSSKMFHQEFESPSLLQDTIKCFWYNKIDLGETASSFEVVPDGYAEIIFHFGNGCSIVHNEIAEPLPSPFIMGLLNQPATFSSKKSLEIIGIRCFPWTVFDLLGLPSGKSGVQLFEHPIAGLQPILQESINSGQIEEAIMHAKKHFMDLHSDSMNNSLLFKAGNALRNTNGKITVNQIAVEAHTTVRTLERNFKQSSGHTVKDVSGLMRFEQVRNHLWLYPDTNLAGLAHELGYTDQSHLNREFKRYSGITPAAFARKGKKEKQALSNFVAFLQS
jgi:AraC-like DNA-binding protein